MKFLADENFPRPAFQVLRNAGFDISWIADDCPGATDDEVLACCAAQNRTLLTFDKDFGELAFRRSLPAESGIVLFRISPQSPQEVATIALSAIRSRVVWVGFFSVITRERIRVRPLHSVKSETSG